MLGQTVANPLNQNFYFIETRLIAIPYVVPNSLLRQKHSLLFKQNIDEWREVDARYRSVNHIKNRLHITPSFKVRKM